MAAHHTHCHVSHEHEGGEARLAIALVATASYMVAEVIGGFLFNSLALLADAGHMVSDVVALALSWLAIRIGRRSATEWHTYGFKRTEIIAAFLNGLALWVIVGVIFYEAGHRFLAPSPVKGKGMLIVASLGLVVNLGMAALLFRSRQENLNLRGAFLHVLSDALGSLGAMAAALFILTTGAYWPDLMVSVLIGILILVSSWSLVRESFHILMEGVPAGIKVPEIEEALLQENRVCCLYDVHVWSISSDRIALSAHAVLSEPDADREDILRGLERTLKERFGITHTTIQIESTHEMRPDAQSPVCRAGTVCETVSQGEQAQSGLEKASPGA